jgi:hypothetical protein
MKILSKILQLKKKINNKKIKKIGPVGFPFELNHSNQNIGGVKMNFHAFS